MCVYRYMYVYVYMYAHKNTRRDLSRRVFGYGFKFRKYDRYFAALSVLALLMLWQRLLR